MLFEEKYQFLSPHDLSPARAIQQRVGREVVIHTLSKKRLSAAQQARIRKLCSNLSRLDHPAIPHLIDFIDTGGEYRLVLEAAVEHATRADTLLDAMSEVEQLTDALKHAQKFNVFHGAIRPEVLIRDQHYSVRVLDLGLRQLQGDDRSARQLAQDDVEQTCRLVEALVDHFAKPPISQDARDEDPETALEQQQIRALASQAQQSKADIAWLNRALSGWTAKARNAREAKKLTFHDEQPSADPAKSLRRRTIVAVSVCAGLLVLGLLSFFFWPATEDVRTATVGGFDSTNSQPQAGAAASPTRVRTVDAFGSAPKTNVASQASDEEMLPVRSDVTPERAADSKITVAIEETATSASGLASKEKPASPPEPSTDEKPNSSPAVRKQEPSLRKESPFKGIRKAVTLPAATSRREVELLQTTLNPDEPLTLRVLGGEGAYKEGEFRLASEFKLASEQASAWVLSFHHQDLPAIHLAELRHDAPALTYSWRDFSGAQGKQANAVLGHVGNLVLVLQSGPWEHAIGLREYRYLPAIKVNLERRKPYEFRIDHLPNVDDVFVEFVPVNGSLTAAFGKGIVRADEKLQIGLDSQKKSLFALSIEPRLRSSKQSLHLQAYGRPRAGMKFVPLARNYGSQLKTNQLAMSRTLFRLKVAKEQVKDEQEKLVRQRITATERDLNAIKKLVETYDAATDNFLQFRIFRQIGSHRVPLVAIGQKNAADRKE